MTKIADTVVTAWLAGKPKRRGNTETDGTTLRLYNTAIATRQDGKVLIRCGAYDTHTTFDRLNAIPGVAICRSKGLIYLNGEEWTSCDDWTDPENLLTRAIPRDVPRVGKSVGRRFTPAQQQAVKAVTTKTMNKETP